MVVCAFIGLGVMGYPMAGHLLAQGHEVRVWNRNPAKSEAWAAEYKGQAHATLKNAVAGAEFVMICVGDDPDVYDVIDPIISALDSDTIVIDHTTTSELCARECYARAAKKQIGFLDAPISGGQSGAMAGQLTIMCGGDEGIYERARPLMSAYAKAMKLMGPSGSGQLTKMVNQICIAGLLQGLSEGVHFAQKAGLDVASVVEAIGQGAAQSWQMDNRAKTMASGEYDFGFAVDWMRKDLGIALRAAKKLGAELPITQRVDDYYGDVQKLGGGRWDTSSLLKRLS